MNLFLSNPAFSKVMRVAKHLDIKPEFLVVSAVIMFEGLIDLSKQLKMKPSQMLLRLREDVQRASKPEDTVVGRIYGAKPENDEATRGLAENAVYGRSDGTQSSGKQ